MADRPDPELLAALKRAQASVGWVRMPVFLVAEDPIRRDDPHEVAAIKASAAAEDWAARLRARGERVVLAPYTDRQLGGDAA